MVAKPRIFSHRIIRETAKPSPATRPRAKTPVVPPRLDPRAAAPASGETKAALPVEVGGSDGPEPTRFGDWEHKGRCTDF